MTERDQWVRADGKRPIQCDGRPASSTKPTTWAGYSSVRTSTAGDGLGFMLGAGIGCYDLDHVDAEVARALMAGIPEPVVYAEWSVSGCGVHVFILAEEGPGSRRDGVERYTRARFIRMTGHKFR